MTEQADTRKENETQKIPILLIEGSFIRIDIDISLRDIDFHVASHHFELGSNFDTDEPLYPYSLPSTELKRLKEEYLKVNGISPDFARLSPDSRLSLIYRMKKKLTLKELDEFLNKILDKITHVIIDLKHPSGFAKIEENARKYLQDYVQVKGINQKIPTKSPIDFSAIKRILIYGSQEEGEKNVLGCLAEMIRRMEAGGLSYYDDFRTLLRFGLSDYFNKLIGEGEWKVEEELVIALAKKLDVFINMLKDFPEIDLRSY